jgi:WD40 repeat protein
MSLEVSGDKLISGGDDSVVRVWNTNNWTCEQLLRAHQVLYCTVIYSTKLMYLTLEIE